jgi:hypothetical protein
MASTTINRGNIQSTTAIAITLGAQTIADASDEVTVTIPGVNVGNLVFGSFAGTQTPGVALVNARVTAANTVKLDFVNSTGSSAVTVAGTYNLLIIAPEATPLPANAA